jgi:hypothetical protein
MTRREKELARALDGFEKTGDHELDSLVETADALTEGLAVSTPAHPVGRAMFIEGVAARKRSFMSSLVAPGVAVIALLIVIAAFGRSALPGESLYPVRNVLRSAGLASAPNTELQAEIDDARLLLTRARSAYERDQDEGERFVIAALMSLGRAEGFLDDVGAADRVTFESRIDALRTQAVSLIHIGDELDDDDRSGRSGDDGSGTGSDDSGSDDDNSGSGGDDDNSGSGSDDSGGDDDNSGSGSSNSGSGSDSSGSGSGSDDADDLQDRQDDLRDEQEDLREDRADD